VGGFLAQQPERLYLFIRNKADLAGIQAQDEDAKTPFGCGI